MLDDSNPLLGDTGCCGLMRITEILRKREEDFEKRNLVAETSTPKQTLEIILYIETNYKHIHKIYISQAVLAIFLKKW
jgi:hypothetical protein